MKKKKMKYNPKKHHRKSIRLKGYDYTREGLYFITICCQDRIHFYGKIMNGEMILNDAGKMISKWYDELENKFIDIKCREMIVMPNHFHCVIENVGVAPRVNPDNKSILDEPKLILGEHVGSPQRGSPQRGSPQQTGSSELDSFQFKDKTNTSLATVIQWFKTMTTNEYIRNVKSKN